VLRSFRSIRRAVAEMVPQLDAYRARVRPLENRAVFEIPDILAGILAQALGPAQGGVSGKPPQHKICVAHRLDKP
jgi:hypothetical protein